MNKNGKLYDSLVTDLEKLAYFVNSNNDIIKDITALELYNDEPQLYSYSSMYTINNNGDNYGFASGVSFNKEVAIIRAIGEAIERYCLDNFNAPIIRKSSILEINTPYLDPIQVSPFSKKQLALPDYSRFNIGRDTQFRWTIGSSLLAKNNVLIPAQLTTFAYDYSLDEKTIIMPLSTGVAAGVSLEDALYRAICEIVERDSYMISYLNKLTPPHINLDRISDNRISKILTILKRYLLELYVLDISTDLNIPAFLAIVIDKSGQGPAVSIGLKAGLDKLEAIIGAIEESLMTRSWIRDKFIYSSINDDKNKLITNIEERALYWFSTDMIEKIDFWLDSKINSKIKIESGKNNLLNEILKLFKEKNTDIFFVNITDERVKRNGFTVVKVIIPDLQPLYLSERYPYLGNKRLYDTPLNMGIISKKNNEETLNKIPHPFL